jgi:hypothetical protein
MRSRIWIITAAAVISLASFALAGCNKAAAPNPSAGAEDAGAAGGTPNKAASNKGDYPQTGDAALDESLRCWALTNGAYMMRQAMGSDQGNLPNPAPDVYITWGKKSALLAFKSGMSLDALQKLQEQAQRAATVRALDVKPDHEQAVKQCIATTPAPITEPDPSWP